MRSVSEALEVGRWEGGQDGNSFVNKGKKGRAQAGEVSRDQLRWDDSYMQKNTTPHNPCMGQSPCLGPWLRDGQGILG